MAIRIKYFDYIIGSIMAQQWSVKEFCKITGLSIRTLHYYSPNQSPPRTGNSRRTLSPPLLPAAPTLPSYIETNHAEAGAPPPLLA